MECEHDYWAAYFETESVGKREEPWTWSGSFHFPLTTLAPLSWIGPSKVIFMS